jgi:hypothetical protein
VVVEMERVASPSVSIVGRTPPAQWRAPLPPWAPRRRRPPELAPIPDAPLRLDTVGLEARCRAVEEVYGLRPSGRLPRRAAAGWGGRRCNFCRGLFWSEKPQAQFCGTPCRVRAGEVRRLERQRRERAARRARGSTTL